jgi:hypothetical protein
MSVSIDTVYQRVLGILNKEQRGYVTPQEFNLFANQAQGDLFEQYFYDINQFGRMPGNNTEYSDMLNVLNEKINIFEKTEQPVRNGLYFSKPNDLYRLGTVIYKNTTTNNFGITTTESIEAERINANEFLYINSSPLTKPKNTRPIFVANSAGYRIYGNSEIITPSEVELNYIKKPSKANWSYQMVFGEALYDSTNSVDFELHPSEQTELVFKILELAGLSIQNTAVYQVANSEEQESIQQEKA